jgi:tRNA pseudouridine32 synthase/23S rRNA pseudouridine746 synthase
MLQGLEVDPIPQKEGINVQSLEVIYEDETLAVINKPSGLLSVPGKDEDYSVALLAKAKWPGSIPVHRLDMGTSGLLIIAKTKNAYQHLQEQFVKHTVEKRYIAVVKGQVKESEGRINLPLRFDPMNRPRQIVDYQHGKSAVTEYKVLDTSQKEHEAVSLLALYPHTGRTHQLRMHCAHEDGLGCPILGDELYGQKDYPRLCLHCDQISFTHPLTDERMHFELPNPFADIFY